MRDIFFKVIKLGVKCVLVMLPVAAFPLYCQKCMLSFCGPDYVGPYWNKEFTQMPHEKYYSTLIIGDSTANAAYLPEVLSDSAVNLGLAGSSTVEGYYTLEDYLANNKAPKDIFVSYMDYHLEEDEFTWDVCNFVHKLSKEQNAEIYKMVEKYGAAPVEELTSPDFDWDVLMYSVYSPTIYSPSVLKSIGSGRRADNRASYQDVDTRLGRYSSITNREYDPENVTGYSKFKVGKLEHEYYKKILELCNKKHINVHLVKLPLSTDSGFIDDYEDEIKSYYDDLIEDYNNADFYWFHTTYEHEFFCDQYHMNNHGAFRFSRELKEQYLDVFKDYQQVTLQRMAAFDLDIAGENYMGELTKRIDDKPYTLVILDGTCNLQDLYYMSVGVNGRDVQWLDLEDNDKYAIYFVSANDKKFPKDITIDATSKDGVVVGIGSDIAQLENTKKTGISFAVVDNVTKKIVCTRQCLFDEKGFRDLLDSTGENL